MMCKSSYSIFCEAIFLQMSVFALAWFTFVLADFYDGDTESSHKQIRSVSKSKPRNLQKYSSTKSSSCVDAELI